MKSTGPMASVPSYADTPPFAVAVAGSTIPAELAVYVDVKPHVMAAASTEATESVTRAPGRSPLIRIVSGVSAAEVLGLTVSCKFPADAEMAARVGPAWEAGTARDARRAKTRMRLRAMSRFMRMPLPAPSGTNPAHDTSIVARFTSCSPQSRGVQAKAGVSKSGAVIAARGAGGPGPFLGLQVSASTTPRLYGRTCALPMNSRPHRCRGGHDALQAAPFPGTSITPTAAASTKATPPAQTAAPTSAVSWPRNARHRRSLLKSRYCPACLIPMPAYSNLERTTVGVGGQEAGR